MTDNNIILQAKGITKRFPGVLANDKVDFDLKKGEIHSLLGENGAGKSTLMNILYGLYHQEEGEMLVNGNAVKVKDPNDSIANLFGGPEQRQRPAKRPRLQRATSFRRSWRPGI